MYRLVPLAILLATACSEGPLYDVRATLEDGQVVVGLVQTPTLLLQSEAGLLEVPLEDVGEVRPSEGGALSASHGNVSVWLRNGTELIGQWAEPELAMGLDIGGRVASVDLPAEALLRVQLQGGSVFPSGDVYRVRTVWGDDVVVDPHETVLAIDSSLGTFEPTLAECASAAPLAEPEGDWRVELLNGTVLIGPLANDSLDFGLPMGPATLTVPLSAFASLEHQQWEGSATWTLDGRFTDILAPKAGAGGMPFDAAPAEAPMILEDAPGWFSSSSLRNERAYQRKR